jgi:hypothetical protein
MTSNEMEEVRTTITLTSGLHVWLRQYALAHRTTFARLIMGILMDWARSHGYSEESVR